MTLAEEILNLLSGITDPAMRMDVNTTIHFLGEMFCIGKVDEDKLRSELRQICEDVIAYSYPDLTDEDIKAKAEEFTDRLVREIRVENVARRMMRRIPLATERLAGI
ncbi:MAG: hypothetical protein QXT16_08705 [Candidatus Caldarchaeum sp.]